MKTHAKCSLTIQNKHAGFPTNQSKNKTKQVTSFPALGTHCKFSRACYRLQMFPRLVLVAYLIFPRLACFCFEPWLVHCVNCMRLLWLVRCDFLLWFIGAQLTVESNLCLLNSVIGSKCSCNLMWPNDNKHAFFLANQVHNQNQPWIRFATFPALGADGKVLLRALIGSLWYWTRCDWLNMVTLVLV